MFYCGHFNRLTFFFLYKHIHFGSLCTGNLPNVTGYTALMRPDCHDQTSNIMSNLSQLGLHWAEESTIQNVNKHMYIFEQKNASCR